MALPRPPFLRHAAAALMLAAALAGCGPARQAMAPPAPVLPAPAPVPAPRPEIPQVSAESRALAAYYAKVQADLLARGMLRTDGGGADTPFTDTMLAEDFIRVALFDEYRRTPAGLVAQETASRLRRWDQPVRVALRFGDSVPPAQRATDTARIASYLARLSAITGHPIALADGGANFFIQVVNEDERRALGPLITATLPELTAPEVAGLINLPRSTYCVVYALSQGASATYARAFAVIRAEHPDLLRLSCIHEEIAQGLGLANDSPLVRPSIFNDDEEFALLTGQDELMLRMLYDPALHPGMSAAEARPVVRRLATALTGGES